MKYSALAEAYSKLEGTSKRLEKTEIVRDFLKKAETKELAEIIYLLQGRVFPHSDERVIGMSSKLLVKAIAKALGESAEKIEKLWGKTGDLGLVAEDLTKNKKQRTLFSQPLTIEKVVSNIKKLAEMTGEGTVNKKVDLIAELLTSADPLEARYICRTVTEELRAGVGPGVLRDAIAWAYLPGVVGINAETKSSKNLHANKAEELKDLEKYDTISADTEKDAREIYNHLISSVQRAYDLTNDFGEVAQKLRERGLDALSKTTLTPGKPIKVMLYEKAENIDDAFERVGTPAAIEPKLDGFRIQIHRSKDTITLYTRRLDNVTNQFPDVEAEARKSISSRDYIIDGEIVGIDPKTHKARPFQEISQRIKRKYEIQKTIKELPVKLMIFDIMQLNGENLLNEPLETRRKKLKAVVQESKNKIELVGQLITQNKKTAEEFYRKMLDEGNEGVMMKNLQGIYKPGLRVGFGVKVKPLMETLDLIIVEAQWGEGKRAKWLSSFTLACMDDGELKTIGKVGTGVKEKKEEGTSFEEMTEELKKDIISEKGKIVQLKPKLVVEISYQEIQRSPTYTSGYALRFPRVVRIRPERGAEDISTLKEVKKLYNKQKPVP